MRAYHTELLPVDGAALQRAALLIAQGEIVAFPTETVYGLGADALRGEAVLKIFAAKERPADNPLIAHVADMAMAERVAAEIPEEARALMEAFWPGPLTLVLKKAAGVPDAVTAGLGTVAVRMPAHPAARALIEAAGCPIAAPSANRSGRPSPTTALHVLEDLDGRVPLILDGGPCAVGVESTVLDVCQPVPVILRPGGVTLEMLRRVAPGVTVSEAVLRPVSEGEPAASPGMKHRHYAPRARVVVVRGSPERALPEIRRLYDEAAGRAVILGPEDALPWAGGRRARSLGRDAEEMAANLYATFRALDAEGAELILVQGTGLSGMGLALMNRLLRAADFTVVEAE